MTTPSIQNVVVSTIWTQVLPSLFERDGAQGTLTVLAARARYERLLNSPRGRPDGLERGLEFPWVHPVGQHFWMHYLERQTMAGLPGRVAWSALVPLRERLVTTKSPTGAILIPEAFHYPFGLGLVFTFRLRDSVRLDDAVGKLYELTHSAFYEIQIDGVSVRGRVIELAAKVLGELARNRTKHPGNVAQPLVDPFSVCTIVQSDSGSAARAPLDPAGRTRKALHGLASWRPTWRTDRLGDLEDCILRGTSMPENSLTYLAKRGRVVWFPELFAPKETDVEPRHSLSCYHRNLTFASLTVDALSSLVLDADDRLGAGGSLFSLPQDHRECVQNAAARLSELYEGNVSTYRSMSARSQLTDSGGRAAYNRLVDRLPDYLQLKALPEA